MDRQRLLKEVLAGITLCGVEAFLLYGHGGALPQTGNAAQNAQSVKYAPVTKLASVQSSQNWAGYVVSSGTYKSVSASWTVPQLQGSQGVAAQWVGLGGVNSQDLLQTGTIEQAGSNGTTAQVFVEELPQHAQDVMTVPVGAKISAAISPVNGSEWDLSVTSSYQGKTQTKTVPMTVASSYVAGMESSAEWIFEDPASTSGSLYPLGVTNNVTFSKVLTNNQPVTSASALVMTGADGQPEVEPSSMKNGSFTTSETSGGSSQITPGQGFPFSEFGQGGSGNASPGSSAFGWGGYGQGSGGGYGSGGFSWSTTGGGGYGSQGYSYPQSQIVIQIPSATQSGIQIQLPFGISL